MKNSIPVPSFPVFLLLLLLYGLVIKDCYLGFHLSVKQDQAAHADSLFTRTPLYTPYHNDSLTVLPAIQYDNLQ